MTTTPRGSLVLILVAVCASAWLYLANLNGHPEPPEPGRHPNLYVDAPDWQLFNEHGEAEKRLTAIRLEQWAQGEPALLVEPRMELRDQRLRDWLLSARRGRVFPDQGPIRLEDEVLLRSTQTGSVVSVATSHLQVARKGDHVETDAPVVLHSGNWHFNAIGLRADLGQQRIDLLEQVKGSNE